MPEKWEKDPCEICVDSQASTISSNARDVHQDCPRCGEFKLTRTASSIMRNSGLGKEKRARLSGWVREQNRAGLVPVITNDNLKKILARPLPSVSDRASSMLIEAEHGLKNLGDYFNIEEPRFLAATYSANKQDVFFLLKMLEEQRFVEPRGVGGTCQILPKGYAKLDEIKKRATTSAQGFVAMWFDRDLDQIYLRGFEVGILDAGYDPVRVDRVEHINKIDDEIIRLINASKFVVADFTGHRGGGLF